MSVRRRTWTNRSGKHEAWIVDYFDAGGVRRNATFERKKTADDYETEVKKQVRDGTHTAPSVSPTVAEAAQSWLAFVEGENRERTTVKQYEEHVRLHILPRLGSAKLAHLTMPAIEAFRDDLLSDLSRPMAKKVLTSLKSILKDAMRRGKVAQNVARDVSIKIASRDKRKVKIGVDIPNIDEIRALLAASGALRPVLVVATFTGLRSSELRGLTWSDIDLKGARLHINQRADRFTPLANQSREKPASEPFRSDRWLSMRSGNGGSPVRRGVVHPRSRTLMVACCPIRLCAGASTPFRLPLACRLRSESRNTVGTRSGISMPHGASTGASTAALNCP